MEALLERPVAAGVAGGVAPAPAASRAAKPAAPVVSTGFTLDAAAPVLAGHFPGHPILPGVMLIGLARQAASATLGQPLRLLRIVRLRFVRPVLPGAVLTLEHELGAVQEDGISRRLVLRWKQADGSICARGELVVG
jgi:3-hydroxymyristoyl/3-hydroxydecanoyl-(acyl carrier protein) dehydratase